MTERRTYRVLVDGLDALDLPLAALRDLADLLVEGTARAARLAGEGRSVVPGTKPAWVVEASELHVTGYQQGSLDLEVTAPVLPHRGLDLFSLQSSDATALDLFLDAAHDAAAGERGSDRLDTGMLEILSKMSGLFDKGATGLTVGRRNGTQLRLDATIAKSIKAMAEATPPPRTSRVTGLLDSLTISSRAFVMKLNDGTSLRGFATPRLVDSFKPLLEKPVVVEGLITYRPSGDALRVEADSVKEADERDAIFAKRPHVDTGEILPREGEQVGGIMPEWPGDETDEELFAALKELE